MHVTRYTNQSQVQVDLEIENTLRKLRKEVSVNTMVVARQQTLKELAAPKMENQLLCINIDNNVNFELKFGFIHLLPTFNGLAGEDPHTHLKEFHIVCVGMKPNGVDEEQVRWKLSLSLQKGQQRHGFSLFSQVLLERGMPWRRFFLRSISQHLDLPTKAKKYVGFDNLMERYFPSIGKYLSNCVFNALIIEYPISCSFNISMKDWCLLTVVSLMLQVEGHW